MGTQVMQSPRQPSSAQIASHPIRPAAPSPEQCRQKLSAGTWIGGSVHRSIAICQKYSDDIIRAPLKTAHANGRLCRLAVGYGAEPLQSARHSLDSLDCCSRRGWSYCRHSFHCAVCAQANTARDLRRRCSKPSKLRQPSPSRADGRGKRGAVR